MYLPDYTCACCDHVVEESLEHLFIQCQFARACWNALGLFVGHGDTFDTLVQLKVQLGVPFFMDIIIVMCWCIWMQRRNPTLG